MRFQTSTGYNCRVSCPKPYFQDGGITIYQGDARELLGDVCNQVECLVTDPVWPNNSVFPEIASPQDLFTEAMASVPASVKRVVVHLGCDSDPRFLLSVPLAWPFFRVCSLEYAQCGYKGRLLVTGDIAYVFGQPPPAKPGAMVLPGKVMSSGQRRYVSRGTGRKKNKSLQSEAYAAIAHPCPRDIDHVQWLVKWFGGDSVVDPFMGIGTTALACKNLGVPFVGIEIKEEFCEIAVSRLRQEVIGFDESCGISV